ncbi:MAG TPA: urease accessory protein UreF [Burkholderiales bacterium]|nr:urease accessory protein UreF [Burkholderiales bacterium]
MHAADLALARLLRLASPMLPVGGFSYSQGLEAAIEHGWVKDEATALAWIGDVLGLSMGAFEAPVWCRLYGAWASGDVRAVSRWNEFFSAARETAELRAETCQMGYSLRALLVDGGEFESSRLEGLRAVSQPTLPTVFSFACVAWAIPTRQALLAYVWASLENQVSAAMRTVPLGQTAGQRLLARLSDRLPEVVDAALEAEDDDLSNCAPGLAIASCRHETQYTRLFRS